MNGREVIMHKSSKAAVAMVIGAALICGSSALAFAVQTRPAEPIVMAGVERVVDIRAAPALEVARAEPAPSGSRQSAAD